MMTTTALELSVAATPESVRRVRREVARAAASAGMRAAGVDNVRLCATEAVSNAVRHAYRAEPGCVDVVVEIDGEWLHVAVRDQGAGLQSPSPSPGSGYGLRLLEALTERFSIASSPGTGTEVRMTFALDGRGLTSG